MTTKAPSHEAAATGPCAIDVTDLKIQIQEARQDIAHDAMAIEVIGDLLAQHDDDCGLSDDHKRSIGWTISRLGQSIMAAHNEIGRLEDSLLLAQRRLEMAA
ncbi:hypothetical protein [Oceanimonas baumannii]|nr:hypothetical protein [Oceanimonas baumannii]OYD25570.1 hypothetical protein B6S09_04995 [Oceanimonas baumannii]